jgi:hypothetical protein
MTQQADEHTSAQGIASSPWALPGTADVVVPHHPQMPIGQPQHRDIYVSHI